MYIVYKHTTPINKVYIGITSQDSSERWRKGEGYRSQMFYKAIQKYGWGNIKHEILFENLTKEEAEQKEIELIHRYKSNHKNYGYNIENGGNSIGKHSEETKKKIGMKNKGKIVSEESRMLMSRNHADVSKSKNPFWGKHFTDEQKQKLKENHKGKQAAERNPMFGKHHTEKTRILQSENRKGKCLGSSNHKSKEIEQFSINGDFIKRFECIRDVERDLNLAKGGGSHISACAKGKLKSAYGYIWKYSEGRIENEMV